MRSETHPRRLELIDFRVSSLRLIFVKGYTSYDIGFFETHFPKHRILRR